MKQKYLKSGITEGVKMFFTSLLTAMPALWTVFLFSGLVTLYFSYDFDIYARFGLKGVEFVTSKTSQAWTRDATVTIYLANPILSFFSGLIFLFLLRFLKKKSSSVFWFLLWITIFSFGNAFGLVIEEGISKSGFYEVSKVLDLGIVVLIIAVAVSLYLLYFYGIIIGKIILSATEENFKQNEKLKISVFLNSLLFPWIINLGIFVFLTHGTNMSQIIIFVMSLIIILPVLWVYPSENKSQEIKPAPGNYLDIITLFVMLMFSLTIYSAIKHGIELPVVW